ncbi:Ribonuclease HII, partial [Haemophilus influenzae]
AGNDSSGKIFKNSTALCVG